MRGRAAVSCEPPSEEDRRAQFDAEGNQIREALSKRQVVMEMSMEVWKVSVMDHSTLETLQLIVVVLCPQEAIELFGIKKGIIPNREEEAEQRPSASGWYA